MEYREPDDIRRDDEIRQNRRQELERTIQDPRLTPEALFRIGSIVIRLDDLPRFERN